MFANRVLKTFGRFKVAGFLRELHSEELHNPDSSSSIIRMIKSGKVRWTGHVTRMKADYEYLWHTGVKGRRKRPADRPKWWKNYFKMYLER
jgi:hypothetical protein